MYHDRHSPFTKVVNLQFTTLPNNSLTPATHFL